MESLRTKPFYPTPPFTQWRRWSDNDGRKNKLKVLHNLLHIANVSPDLSFALVDASGAKP